MEWLQGQHPGCAAEVLLSASGGSPLQALALIETDVVERRQRVFQEFGELSRRQLDPIGIAERWHGQPHEECVNWMLSWVADMIYLLMTPAAPCLSNADLEVELTQLAKIHRICSLIDFRSELLNIRQALGTQVNRQLLLEEALIGWSRLARHST
jgi:hypothetical protein